MARGSALDQAGKHPRVREFLKQLRTLYADVRTWLPHELRIREDTKNLHEEAFGQYEAPALRITQADGSAIATLEPVGASIIGAKARVDLKGSADVQPILYLLKGGPVFEITVTSTAGGFPDQRVAPVFKGVTTDGWYWVDGKRPRQAHPLDRDAFLKLLRFTADYGEAQPA